MRFDRFRPDPRPGTEDEVVARRVAAYVVDQFLVAGTVAALASVALGVGAGVLGVGVELDLLETPLRSLAGNARPITVVAVGAALFAVVTAIATFAYFAVAEGATGRTVGKALFGLVVVRTDGSPVGYRAALVRTLLRPVDSFPSLYLLGLGSIAASDRRQRIGDRVAGTVVVAAASTPRAPDATTAGTPT